MPEHPGSRGCGGLRPEALPVLATCALLASLVAPPPSLGGENEQPPQSAETPSVSDAPAAPASAAGWRVYRDPQTGELLSAPLPGQAESLTAKWETRRSGQRPDLGLRTFPVILRGRTIGLGVALDDRFVTSTVLMRNALGDVTLSCVDGPRLPEPSPAATLEER